MATLREIRGRIRGVKSTQQITKAMKMVSAAKLRRAQEAVIQTRPYARKLNDMMRHLIRQSESLTHPLLTARPIGKVALVVVTADRGLCGAFNVNVLRAATQRMQAEYAQYATDGNLRLFTVGKKGTDFFTKRGFDIARKFPGIFAHLEFTTAKDLAGALVDGYMRGEFDKVEIIYNEFKNILQQKLVIEQVLPIPPEDISHLRHAQQIAQTEYIYEPDPKELINILAPLHINYQMWRVLLESNAAEHGARMSAMDNATLNANELIRSLSLSYNKARQAAITKELLEIVGGAEALQSS